MKKVSLYLALVFLLLPNPECCAKTKVLRNLDIDVVSGDWQAFINQWQGSKKPSIDVRFNGVSAVMKYHGSIHTRKNSKKPAFRLHWRDSSKNRRTVILKAGYFDHTRIREWLGLRMFAAAGILSPEARFVRLRVNGNSLGIYLAVTPVDALYVRNLLGRRLLKGLYSITVTRRQTGRLLNLTFYRLGGRNYTGACIPR